jgi:hypothetical protein
LCQVRVWLAVVVGLALAGRSARADLGNDVGADAVVVVPYGDWAAHTNVGLGAAARVRVPLTSDTTITARVAAIAHLGRDVDIAGATATTHVLEFPLLGGVRYRVSGPGRVRGFVFGELGIIFRRTDVAFAGAHDDDVKIVFGSALGAGVALDRFELTAAVWLPDLAEVDHTAGAIVSVGGAFASW